MPLKSYFFCYFYIVSLLIFSTVFFKIGTEAFSVESNKSFTLIHNNRHIVSTIFPSEASEGIEDKCRIISFNQALSLSNDNFSNEQEDKDECRISLGSVILVSLLFNAIFNCKKFMKMGTI
jgi:hypothetical protein